MKIDTNFTVESDRISYGRETGVIIVMKHAECHYTVHNTRDLH